MKRRGERWPSRKMQYGERGIALAEILMVIGILGIVAASVTSLFSVMLQNQKSLESKFDSQTQVMNVQAVLMDERACFNSLGGMKPAQAPSVTQIKTAANTMFLNMHPASNVNENSSNIPAMTLADDGVDPAAFATLSISFARAPASISRKPYTLHIAVEKAADGSIQRCSAFGLAQAKLAFANVTCPTGKLIQGFDANGDPVCVAPPAQAAAAPATAATPPSGCGGTQSYGAVVHTMGDDGAGNLQGLSCGQLNGTARQCYSCSAQWMYPAGHSVSGGVVNCMCH